MPISQDPCSKVFTEFVSHCVRPDEFALGFIEPDQMVFNCPADLRPVEQALRSKFPDDVLVDSGLFTIADDGCVFTTALAPNQTIVLLVEIGAVGPYEILTEAGCLRSQELPMFAVLKDHHTKKLLNEGEGDLMVAFTLPEMVFLRACGFPATLANGLGELSLEESERCQQTFGTGFSGDHGKESAYSPGDPFRRNTIAEMQDGVEASERTEELFVQLVLVAWSPLTLSNAMSGKLKQVVDRLNKLNEFFDLDISDIGVWEVSAAQLERLKFIAGEGALDYFKVALHDTSKDIGAGVEGFGKDQPLAEAPPKNYHAALTLLTDVTVNGGDNRFLGPDQRSRAMQNAKLTLDRDLIGPLREMAEWSGNPLQKNVLMVLAEMSSLFHTQSLGASQGANKRMARRGNDQDLLVPEEQIKQLTTIADRVLKYSKEAREWEKPRTLVGGRVVESKTSPRLPYLE